MRPKFRSLRLRLLVPLLLVAVVAAVGVAALSYWLGDRWARQQIATRYDGIATSLGDASFPLTSPIVSLLADLTETELVTIAEGGELLESSLPNAGSAKLPRQWPQADVSRGPPERLLVVADRSYRYAVFRRSGAAAPNDQTDRVAVLFDEQQLRASRWRAAGLPLVTGLSTIVLLASLAFVLAGRWVARLQRLQRGVNRIADGHFDAEVESGGDDEIGLLGAAVNEMSRQLQEMWRSLHRQESEKLLHQIAGGLAHQLRNSLTGARMAVELHDTGCPQRDDESLRVALSQLEQTEDHVRRLLLASAGKQDDDRPGSAWQCLADIRTSLQATAKHRKVDLRWQIDESVRDRQVADTPSLSAATTNLVLNAMQAASHVRVKVFVPAREDVGGSRMRVEVTDDGPGPPADIAEDLFEPFVTSKPEGLGLGLPLVRRSAERLSGSVEWERIDDETRFLLDVAAH